MILFFFTIILVMTGGIVEGADASRLCRRGSKTTTAIKPTYTSDSGGGGDEGLSVYGSSDLPMPFDTNIGSTTFMSTTCPAFFNLFLNDPSYRDCLPLSAMLQVCRHLLCSHLSANVGLEFAIVF